MKHLLLPHSKIDNLSISTTVKFRDNSLLVHFVLSGKLEEYVFPKKNTIKRAHKLWKKTCFELFLAKRGETTYYELNFSPSLEWNFYCLSDYRSELKVVENVSLEVKSILETNRYELELLLESEEFNFSEFNLFNIAAILLTTRHKRTFWTLNPQKGTPNFHLQKSFLVY
jgi:hypothetical protein